MYIYIYIYIHIHTHIYIHTCMHHIYIHTHTHKYIRTHICIANIRLNHAREKPNFPKIFYKSLNYFKKKKMQN